jgi:hypothetical protein
MRRTTPQRYPLDRSDAERGTFRVDVIRKPVSVQPEIGRWGEADRTSSGFSIPVPVQSRERRDILIPYTVMPSEERCPNYASQSRERQKAVGWHLTKLSLHRSEERQRGAGPRSVGCGSRLWYASIRATRRNRTHFVVQE